MAFQSEGSVKLALPHGASAIATGAMACAHVGRHTCGLLLLLSVGLSGPECSSLGRIRRFGKPCREPDGLFSQLNSFDSE